MPGDYHTVAKTLFGNAAISFNSYCTDLHGAKSQQHTKQVLLQKQAPALGHNGQVQTLCEPSVAVTETFASNGRVGKGDLDALARLHTEVGHVLLGALLQEMGPAFRQ